MVEDPLEPLFVVHKIGMRALAVTSSTYWKLVRLGKIQVVGRKRGSRASWASIKAYAAERLAAAQAEKAA
jgi:hypothetical protein